MPQLNPNWIPIDKEVTSRISKQLLEWFVLLQDQIADRNAGRNLLVGDRMVDRQTLMVDPNMLQVDPIVVLQVDPNIIIGETMLGPKWGPKYFEWEPKWGPKYFGWEPKMGTQLFWWGTQLWTQTVLVTK